MDDISTSQALGIPAALTLLTLTIAAVISLQTGVSASRLFMPYLGAWAACTLLSVLIWIFVQIVILFPSRAEDPIRKVAARLHEPLKLAPLPAVIFPLFLGGYTWAKSSIPFSVGYGWEGTWANLDRVIFKMDAWRWAHALMPDDSMLPFSRGLIAAQQGILVEAVALCAGALTDAPAFLREQMEATLRGDPRYAALAVLLLEQD